MTRNRSAIGVLALIATLAVAALAATSAGAHHKLPVIHSFPVGQAQGLLTGAAAPGGANDYDCELTSQRPRPVILVHGTIENQRSNWNAMSPFLANKNFCVFTFNYGNSQFPNGPFYGLDHVPDSAAQLKTFVDHVLSETGASKVDLVGHSQGGMMPRWYIQFLGGADKVENLVALAASNNGTTLSGITGLIGFFPDLADQFVFSWCKSCQDQVEGSPMLQTLNAGGGTSPSVTYTNIVTKYDQVVTPYTSGYLSGSNVTNIRVQDGCIIDLGEHLAISYDRRAMWYVAQALGANQWWFTKPCTPVVPLVGG